VVVAAVLAAGSEKAAAHLGVQCPQMDETRTPGPPPEALARGREAYAREAWAEAHRELTAVDTGRGNLEADDLERMGNAAYLVGRDDEAIDAWTRAYRALLEGGLLTRAARAAFWLGMGLLDRGEEARGAGWLARAATLVERHGQPCVEQGYLLVPDALRRMEAGDVAGARETFSAALAIAERFGDVDLAALGRLGVGEAMIRFGEVEGGVALLDEAMVSVTAGEVSPPVVGIAYCSTIETCLRIHDLRRGAEWTAALAAWCRAHPDLVPYRGACLVYRAELLTLHGGWSEAMAEARSASSLARPGGDPIAADARYREAEVHRLRGEEAEADDAYREANRLGRIPQPGLALLRLAQGRVTEAAAALRRAIEEAAGDAGGDRAKLLAAGVEAMVAAGEAAHARTVADELAGLAAGRSAPLLVAMAARADGEVRLAAGDPAGALASLRRALVAWHAIDAPYEAAACRVLIARACRAMGDEETAGLELDAARRTFQGLGAAPALAALAVLDSPAPSPASDAASRPAGLTPRELEVLRLVATGRTNRSIADELVLSEKTVARHVANIFTKLGVSSRSGATAYAYEHGVVVSPPSA